MPISTTNPATGETLQTFEALGDQEIEERLEHARAAFEEYRTTGFAERAE
ncbi:aldehyde dehydrogenase family protein, partial [Streptomyces sp. S1A]